MPAIVFVGGGHAGDLILGGGSIWPPHVTIPLRPPHRGQSKIPGKACGFSTARFGILVLPQPC
jgi:hypothetical protein